MNSALVLSHKHHLLPVAHRLRLEGVDVEVATWRGVVKEGAHKPKENRFDRAWEGVMGRVMRSAEITQHAVEGMVDLARDGKTAVLTSAVGASKMFSEAARLLPRIEPEMTPQGPLRLGAWWNGEAFVGLHMLYADQTTWPMGIGPGPEGAMALVRIDDPELHELFHGAAGEVSRMLGGIRFRGLVQLGLFLDAADGKIQIRGGELGWPWLHTHAFLSELENLSAVVLEDEAPVISKRFTVVVPVTMPPWPWQDGKAEEVPIKGLTTQKQGQVFWHDVHMKDGELWTAGLDGLVGVCRGAANTPELARAKALADAVAIELPSKQFRPDAVQSLSAQLAMLE